MTRDQRIMDRKMRFTGREAKGYTYVWNHITGRWDVYGPGGGLIGHVAPYRPEK